MTLFKLAIGFCIGVHFGNWGGDQLTLRNCATSYRAQMYGGGSVVCLVEEAEVAAPK